MIGHVRDGATFVEVGCWLGKSTAYCARRILESGKAIRFVAVDTWEGSPSEPDMTEAVARAGGSVFPLFCANMEELGVSGSIHIMKMPSVAAAGLFENGSLDFVFIDADHSREALQADITAWRPKIGSGGTLAGHDWHTYVPCRKRSLRSCLGTSGSRAIAGSTSADSLSSLSVTRPELPDVCWRRGPWRGGAC